MRFTQCCLPGTMAAGRSTELVDLCCVLGQVRLDGSWREDRDQLQVRGEEKERSGKWERCLLHTGVKMWGGRVDVRVWKSREKSGSESKQVSFLSGSGSYRNCFPRDSY